MTIIQEPDNGSSEAVCIVAVIGTLYVVSGPSGVGKSSLVRATTNDVEQIMLAVSYTTRARRPGERDGVDYHFVSTEQFQRLADEGAFLEHARVFDHYYGTPKTEVVHKLKTGIDVILEIDWQGRRQVVESLPGTVGIFVLPPSRSALKQRLQGRGQDSGEVMERRMQDAVDELSHYDEFDYLLVNNDFDSARDQLRCIVQARRLRRDAQCHHQKELLKELLE